MVPSIQIWVVDQDEQNEQHRGNFTGIKDESILNIYVKCEGEYVKIWQYDGNRGGVYQNMTVDDNRGDGGQTTLQKWRNIWMIP